MELYTTQIQARSSWEKWVNYKSMKFNTAPNNPCKKVSIKYWFYLSTLSLELHIVLHYLWILNITLVNIGIASVLFYSRDTKKLKTSSTTAHHHFLQPEQFLFEAPAAGVEKLALGLREFRALAMLYSLCNKKTVQLLQLTIVKIPRKINVMHEFKAARMPNKSSMH